ncbi:hypothetical protein [Helicobacter sp. T3_23-1059]
MLKFSRIVLLEVKPKRDCIMLLLITFISLAKPRRLINASDLQAYELNHNADSASKQMQLPS